MRTPVVTPAIIGDLRQRARATLGLLEQHLPITELCYLVHLIGHVPDYIADIGPVREDWCFRGESVGGDLMRMVFRNFEPEANLARNILKLFAGRGRISRARGQDEKNLGAVLGALVESDSVTHSRSSAALIQSLKKAEARGSNALENRHLSPMLSEVYEFTIDDEDELKVIMSWHVSHTL
jgi:hypothetical protein